MTDHLKNIRAKLTDAELAFLKQAHGIELRDPKLAAALSEIDDARAQIMAIEERAIRHARERTGERPQCSFCDATSLELGPLAKSPRGPTICRACAKHCIDTLAAEDTRDV